MSDTTLGPRTGSQRRLITSTLLGTTIEFFDLYIYSLAAGLYFAHLFFPSASPTVGVIASFGTLAAGFLARPLGGIVGGHFGDRYGRKKVLVASMLIMGISTFVVGVLPTYETIGMWAPILLISARIAQGLGAGAEWGGGVLMLVEHMRQDRRGFWGSIVAVGTWIGICIGTLFFAALTRLPDDVQQWAWRAPFIASAALVLVGLWIRIGVSETPIFVLADKEAKTAKRERLPLAELFQMHKKAMLIAVCVALGPGTYQLYVTFATSYAKMLNLDMSTILLFHFANGIFAIAATLFFGWLSDLTGRRIMLIGGSVLVIPAMYMLFWSLNEGRLSLVMVSLIVLEIGHSMVNGPLGAFLAERFETTARYTGVSIAYQVGAGAIAGLGPLIATTILANAGGPPNVYGVPLIAVVMGILISIGAWVAPEMTRKPLPDKNRVVETSHRAEAV
ncbi:MFS transporter [Rhodococcus koreensis]|uniref:MFS transporter n=1 Tax=Rhodococcus koreensis TaxID=99653 RepID=UPI003672F5BF